MLIMSFMNSEKEALDLPAIVTGNGEAYPKQWLAVYVPSAFITRRKQVLA